MTKSWLDVLTDCAKAQQDMHAANQAVEQAERSFKAAQKVAQKARDQYEKSRLDLVAAAEDQVSQISGIPRDPQISLTVQQDAAWRDAMKQAVGVYKPPAELNAQQVRDWQDAMNRAMDGSNSVLGAQVDPQSAPYAGLPSGRIWSGSLFEK